MGILMRERLTSVALALCLIGSQAHAQEDPDTLARRHFESGVAYLVESDYDNALKAFEKAYELSKRPDLLLNIATVHERTSQLGPAIDALQRYLAAAPEGEQADTVRLRLANLEKRKAEQDKNEAVEKQRAPIPPTSKEPARPAPAPPSAAVAPGPNRLPAIIAFGAGGLALTGAIVTGAMAQSEYNSVEKSCSPDCDQDDISSGKQLALISTVLTGAAVVGAGVGLVLWFGDDEKPSQGRLHLTGAAHAHGASARAVLTF
jgi:tetratricopeptide (TPR) repeat protein